MNLPSSSSLIDLIKSKITIISLFFCCFTLASCQPGNISPGQMLMISPAGSNSSVAEIDKFLPVDCLLPGQIRRLGGTVYQSGRRPIKTTARDCEIRGGEYVVQDRANYATALKIWLPQAQAGDAEAQAYVGDIYQQGLGTSPRYEQAAQWYRKAAEQENTRAQMSLGYLYEKGLGVPKNQELAHGWYRKASGLKDFVPTDEGSLNSLERKELLTLREEVEKYRSDSKGLRRQLEKTTQELDRTRRQLEKRQDTLESERIMLQKDRRELEERKTTAVPGSGKELLDLDRKLSKREVELSEQRLEIERLHAELNSRVQAAENERRNLNELQKKLANLPPPFIEINDPTLLATRSVRLAWVEPQQSTRKIAGRVWAPAGISKFTINDRKEELKPDGDFTSTVPLKKDGETEVRIVAIDSQNKKGSVQFSLKPQEGAGKVGPVAKNFPDIDFGNYHALIIGNQEYANFPKLKTPIRDAEEIAKILDTKYGFKVKVLRNASKVEIIQALEEYLRKLDEDDNFLLYYAGHGGLDKVNSRGYWLSVNAVETSTVERIPNTEIFDLLNIMTAKQILVIADTCFAGIMTRSTISHLEPAMSNEVRRTYLKKLAKQRSRMVLSSGEDQPVLDVGGGEHSVFAKVLLDVLKTNNEVIEGLRLYQQINARVLYNSEEFGLPQVPQYNASLKAGHKSGDFILVPKI